MEYYKKYIKDDKLDLPSLINDDFWKAIRVCFNNKLYVSSMKLLLSFIDSISFVAYGTSDGRTFQKWLENYCDMSSLGIKPFELWEHRNSMLHMTSLSSRKVDKLECRMLVGYVGNLPQNFNPSDETCGYYDIYALIVVISKGLEKYTKEKNDLSDFSTLLLRYDLIVSDVRTLNLTIE